MIRRESDFSRKIFYVYDDRVELRAINELDKRVAEGWRTRDALRHVNGL